ncbi:MAG: hypothetical protein ABUR63_00580 [Verrucomicrobiota bacterium]
MAAAPLTAITAVAFGPDRFTLSLADDATGRRREIDCLYARPWLSLVLAVLGPVLRFATAGGRLRVRPHPFGVLFALDALIHLGALSRASTSRQPYPGPCQSAGRSHGCAT